MYVMLLLGTIGSALAFGWLLEDFTPGKLIQVIQGAAVVTVFLNILSLWKQEPRDPSRTRPDRVEPGFGEAWASFTADGPAIRRLCIVGLGTMGFAMQEVLLEPYGGETLKLAVGQTTMLTATLALGGLIGFGLASRALGRGGDPFRMSAAGVIVGVPGFVLIALAAPFFSVPAFVAGILVIGLGGGLFAHGTLTATMQAAPREQVGLALGAWGAAQATAAGLAMALGGALRDLVAVGAPPVLGRATGYVAVYALEVLLLLAALLAMGPLLRRSPGR
jgi:BCD family chlorophyll transporter-like MFS transporter